MKNKYFNFGINWASYSKKALKQKSLAEAQDSLVKLIGKENIKDKSFLDIGFGSGIFAIAAKKLGAKEVYGIEISDESMSVAKNNLTRMGVKDVKFHKFDILSENYKRLGKHDIVYAWGVLHHTGNLEKAMDHTGKLVRGGGLLVVAVYNKHWTSPIWRKIKIFYNPAPKFAQKIMILFFFMALFLAKFFITFKNPLKMERGMDFYHDVVDWVGGYPYEYATSQEIIDFFSTQDFKLLKFLPAQVPTGNNQFVFQKKG